MMAAVLSYRHAYHAGNHADVLKHLVLASCLEYLGRKETPYRYVDTHAGAGGYDLSSGYGAEHEEWRNGTERLRAFVADSRSGQAPPAVRRYLELVDAFRSFEGGDAYPGSPAIAATFLRQDDRATLFELHPVDHATLEERFAGDDRIQVRKADGLAGLRSLLPPPSRRALVLIDPSYEVKDEYGLVVETVADALRRFATGVYVIWYPILEREEAQSLPDRLFALETLRRCKVELRVKLPREDGRGMCGSGVIILNPPWTLREVLEESLPYLERALGDETSRREFIWEEKTGPEDATQAATPVSKNKPRPQGRIVQ
jgi:23S rRNA (adenine2030-N6)-methyltransferase